MAINPSARTLFHVELFYLSEGSLPPPFPNDAARNAADEQELFAHEQCDT